jgi:hypothetical protein
MDSDKTRGKADDPPHMPADEYEMQLGDNADWKRTVISAVIQGVVREVIDAVLRIVGRGGPF